MQVEQQQSPRQHMRMPNNSRWNAVIIRPSCAARTTLKECPSQCCRHADIQIASRANVQWLAVSRLTAEWSSVDCLGACKEKVWINKRVLKSQDARLHLGSGDNGASFLSDTWTWCNIRTRNGRSLARIQEQTCIICPQRTTVSADEVNIEWLVKKTFYKNKTIASKNLTSKFKYICLSL